VQENFKILFGQFYHSIDIAFLTSLSSGIRIICARIFRQIVFLQKKQETKP